jgi:hypothetical protein
MGRVVNGIMFGARMQRKLRLVHGDDKASKPGLVELWEKRSRSCKDVPSFDENEIVFGFWVAVRDGDENGIPDLEVPVSLDEVPTTKPYAKAYVAAKERWAAFAAFSEENGVTLPAARLFLTVTEVA